MVQKRGYLVKLNFKLCVFILLCSILLSPLENVHSNETKIKIGAILPLSGALSSLGLGSKKGLDIAVKHINESGGIGGKAIEIVFEDSLSEPSKAISAFNAISSRKDILPVVYLTLSSVTQAIKPLSNSREIFLMSDATLPDLLDNSKYLVRRSFNIESFAERVVSHLNDQGIERISLIVAEEEWGSIYLEKIKNNPKIETIAHEEIAKDTADVKSSLLRLKSKSQNTQALVVILVGSIQLTTLRQIKQIGFDVPVYTYLLCSQDGVSQNVDMSLNGVMSFEAKTDRSNELFKVFESEYKKNNTLPLSESISFISYDFIYLLKEAVESIGVDKVDAARLKEYVTNKMKFTGITGNYEFNDSGDSAIMTEPYVFRDGRCDLIE